MFSRGAVTGAQVSPLAITKFGEEGGKVRFPPDIRGRNIERGRSLRTCIKSQADE